MIVFTFLKPINIHIDIYHVPFFLETVPFDKVKQVVLP